MIVALLCPGPDPFTLLFALFALAIPVVIAAGFSVSLLQLIREAQDSNRLSLLNDISKTTKL